MYTTPLGPRESYIRRLIPLPGVFNQLDCPEKRKQYNRQQNEALCARSRCCRWHDQRTQYAINPTTKALLTTADTFPYLIADNQVSGEWEYVRRTANKWSHGPVTDVTSRQIRCYEEQGRPPADVKGVTAGSTVGFKLQAPVQHIGPLLYYMARVPDGQDVNSWEADGNVWFKIKQVGPETNADGSWSWPPDGESPCLPF
jgi:hypothetical protein